MDLVRFMSVVALTSPRETAIVTETNSMLSEYVVAIVLPMPMPMAFVTTWMTAWVHTTLVEYAMDQVKSSSAVVQTSLKEIVTATEISSTLLACVAETVLPTPMLMESVMMWMIVLERLMRAESAMDLVPFTSAVVMTSPKEIAIVMEINSMLSEYVVVIVLLTPMPMAFVTT